MKFLSQVGERWRKALSPKLAAPQADGLAGQASLADEHNGPKAIENSSPLLERESSGQSVPVNPMTSKYFSRLPILWDALEPDTVNASLLPQRIPVGEQKVLCARRVMILHNKNRVEGLELG